MNTQDKQMVEAWYREAENHAQSYFQRLLQHSNQPAKEQRLIRDIMDWKRKHVFFPNVMYRHVQKRNEEKKQDAIYYQWLAKKGKLDTYLQRSIAYIYLRDLGKDLSQQSTGIAIKKAQVKLKSLVTEEQQLNQLFSVKQLYRWAQKEQVEEAVIWAWDKINMVTDHLPDRLHVAHAKRKLIKTIAGVVMQALDEIQPSITNNERQRVIDRAIRLGYAYGITYPLIDDLLDADVLTDTEKQQFSKMIEVTIVTRTVPTSQEKQWSTENYRLMKVVYQELAKAFELILSYQNQSMQAGFLKHAYVFYKAQEIDRAKNLSYGDYSNQEIYLPVILKSASSRIISKAVLATEKDETFTARMFYYGIYNQLSDDFADIYDDLQSGAVTPYTYYLTYQNQRPDLLNPFALYWHVIGYLIHDVYHSDHNTREVILDRAINGLKRFKEKHGDDSYQDMMKQLQLRNKQLQQLIEKMVNKANDVDFLDKRLRDQMFQDFEKEQKEKQQLKKEMDDVRYELHSLFDFPQTKQGVHLRESITEAATYSLQGNGKRLRPIMTWIVANKIYGIDKAWVMPLLKSLELMHTASLIFDDLPTQDNASIRRGRATLHEAFDQATAELTGLFLTQQATLEQASLHHFEPKNILKMIRYASHVTSDMCKGQLMDLETKATRLTLSELNTMCFYKTGLGFEAALLMPAILIGVDDSEQQLMKQFAYHAGIAFQIKDDLLDAEGNDDTLGKSSGMDEANQRSTFVSILGRTEARKKMWEHYCSAEDSLEQLPPTYHRLSHLLHHLIHRQY